MKRSHDEIGSKKKSPLGALEFAAALNGEDARAVLSALSRFTKTVKRQRRQALSLKHEEESDHEEESSSSSEEDLEEEESLGKKRKHEQEAWMEDTGAFDVPFVGTSVQKGDSGTVVAGQWPTGLLQVYLKASPMAVELVSGALIPPTGHLHKRLLSKKSKHGKKASQAIYRAYLEALAQVITANVPVSTLQRDYGIDKSSNAEKEIVASNSRDSIASVLLKERLVDMMHLINDESGGGKMMDRTLVANALRILANLSATSLGAAREVTRALDAILKDGILKSLLRAKQITTSNSTGKVKVEQRDDSVRIECLRLATILAGWQDSAITAYITTKGSRERKIGAGILYLAIRLGLHDSAFTDGLKDDDDDDDDGNDKEYMQAVTRLLRAVRLVLLDSSGVSSRRPLLSTRDLVDLFSGEALSHISQIACCAPTYEGLADGDFTSNSDATAIEEAGLVGRRILFAFLADPTKSPFLMRIKYSKADDNQGAHCAQQLVRAMMLLLHRCPSLSTQRFLIECLQTTTTLVPHFFKMVTVPDPKQTFAFIARMGFLFRLVREAPAVSSCVEKDVHFNEEQLNVVVASIVPANIKKHLLTKGLKSPNALIVSETLKLLYALINRYHKCVADIGGNQESQRFLGLVTDATVRAFPDMQSLLSVRSLFDPFTSEDDTKAAIIIIGQFCKVLDSLALYLPAILNSVKFDFTKLLPHDASIFCSTSPVLQYQLLYTLEKILALQQEQSEHHRLSSSGVRLVLEIVGAAKQNQVYQKARSIAMAMIHLPLDTGDPESSECAEYESSLWIDGMSEQCLDSFCSLLCDPSNSVFQHSITVASAWKKADLGTSMPPVSFSPLVSASLKKIAAATSSGPFILFTCQVVTKCLLYQRYPLLLASLIVDTLADIASETRPVILLYRYAQSLLSRDNWDARECLNRLSLLLQYLFTHSCIQNELMRNLREDSCLDLSMAECSINDIKASVRQCLHVTALDSISADTTKKSFQQLRKVVPLLSQNERPGKSNSNLDSILGHPIVRSGRYPSTELAYINVASVTLPEEISASESADQMNNILVSTIGNALLPNQVPREEAMREILRHICQAITDQNAPGFVAYTALALYWMENHSLNHSWSYMPLNTALDTWRIAVKSSHFEKLTTMQLARALEASLSEAMETGEPKRASLLYSLILKSPPSDTIQACIRCKQMNAHDQLDSNQSQQCFSLLSNLIAADPTVFGTSFLGFLAQRASKNDALQLLEGGFFDEEVAMLSRMNNISAVESFREVRDAVVLRSLQALSSKPSSIRAPRTTHVEDGLTSLLSLPEMIQSNQIDAFIELACSALRIKPNKLVSSGAVWSSLSHSLLCSTDPECAVHETMSQGRLASILLIHDLKRLRLYLKSHFKSSPQESKSESRSATLEALEQITEFTAKQTTFDDTVLVKDGPDVMNDVIKSALKYGLSHLDDLDSKISERCLRLVRILIVEASGPSSSLHKLQHTCLLLAPSTVLTMVLSHSRFHESIRGIVNEEANSAAFSATLELIRLMLVCTSLSSDTVLFEHEVWSTLLSAYNAGTTLVDITIRRLLDVYANSLVDRDMTENLPRMESFRWRGMALANDSSPNALGWDWLVSGLEMARIRATISQFPVHDSIKADPIKDVESWLDTSSENVMTAMDVDEEEDVDMSSGDSSCKADSDVSVEDDAMEDSHEIDGKRQVIDLDVWKGLGKDIRYSPGFILPLILCALENSLSKSTHSSLHDQTKNDSLNDEKDGSTATTEFVVVTQCLVERGALSLALGSLCSECSSLRKVAVATLVHIKKALDTEEARKLSTWRERPQLAMIVDSVQRGLAVRIAMRLDPHEQEPSSLNIPKLPALSTVFLARAALIIVKPGDQMFGPMNRYFLRLDDGHGAFQDTNRLPAFISLFCSSANEPGQARRERLWALQLMKDSFVEAYCYRMIESCHAPELVMSTFQSIRSRQEDDQHDSERILLIDTLASMLENGGRRAASHLIGRLGLLSWIRGQLVSDDVMRVLPSLGSRIAFLRLTFVALSMSRLYLADEDSDKQQLLMESRMMINNVAMLYDDSICRGLSSFLDQRGTVPPDLLATLSSDTLAALVNIMKDLGSSEDVKSVQKYGISLNRAVRILQTIPQNLESTTILSLCIVPVCLDESIAENTVTFCELVLSFLSTNQVDEETSTAVLKRVSLLISLMKKPLDSAGYGLVDALLSSRHACLQRCRYAWLECLKEVIDRMNGSGSAISTSTNASTDSLCIARDILESATGTWIR